jgi:hypothetical protein
MRGLASLGLALVVAGLGYWYARFRARTVDPGSVSESWLAEKRNDPYDPGS